MLDVLLVGGGVIGLSSARALAREGLSVAVLDAAEPAQASAASGGILGPQSEVHAPGPLFDLCWRSLQLWEGFVRGLPDDLAYLRTGTLHVARSPADEERLSRVRAWQRAAGLPVEERLTGAHRGLFFPAEGCVDPRRLLAALRSACAAEGVLVETGRAVRVEPERVVEASGRERRARTVVVTAGAWSGPLAALPVGPQTGQALLLDTAPPPSVVFGAGGYLVPRGARVLVGATSEDTGFAARPTPEGLEFLLGVARELGLPAGARVVEHWAGLRPRAADELPLLGRTAEGLVVATGHFRNGVLLAPVTAGLVGDLVLGRTPDFELRPFSPTRTASG